MRQRVALFRCDRCGSELRKPIPDGLSPMKIGKLPPGGWRVTGIRHICFRCGRSLARA